jgi:hypothetical protein
MGALFAHRTFRAQRPGSRFGADVIAARTRQSGKRECRATSLTKRAPRQPAFLVLLVRVEHFFRQRTLDQCHANRQGHSAGGNLACRGRSRVARVKATSPQPQADHSRALGAGCCQIDHCQRRLNSLMLIGRLIPTICSPPDAKRFGAARPARPFGMQL